MGCVCSAFKEQVWIFFEVTVTVCGVTTWYGTKFTVLVDSQVQLKLT